MMFTEEKFKAILPDVSWDFAKKYIPFIDDTLAQYQIDLPLRKVHFLAQVTHESGGFKYTAENLNYSATALYAVFRKYFPTMDVANQYERQPQKIANKVYANRLGNGDEASNDGWNYKGRGLIQLTGKDNYTAFSNDTGQDFVVAANLVEEPKWAITSACWFWKKRNLNQYADADDIHMVTKLINGGTNGLANRQHYLEEFKKIYGI